MDSGQILYATREDNCFIKLIGAVRYTHGNGLNAIIESTGADELIRGFIIDLSEAVYLDSTILGLLAKVARLCSGKARRTPVVVSSNPDVTILLQNMGFQEFFTLIPQYDLPTDQLARIPGLSGPEAGTILEAHQILMDMNEKNRDQFHDVVELLRGEAKPARKAP